MDKKRYKQIIDKNTPKPDKITNALVSFLVGGALGALGELLLRTYSLWLNLPRKESGVLVTLTFITIASVLTALGVFDVLVAKVKAGLIIPITGFAHSITSSIIDYKREGLLNMGSNAFKLAGSVILYGIVSAVILTLIKVLLNV